jgi:SAM-dependent methyltransferase
LWALADETAAQVEFNLEFIKGDAAAIPLDRSSADTVLVTYTLCTVPRVVPALEEIRRVLKPDGQLIFCEHGAAPDPAVRRWQNRLNPIWKRFGGGCNLNLPIPSLLEQAGFTIIGARPDPPKIHLKNPAISGHLNHTVHSPFRFDSITGIGHHRDRE